VACSARRVQMSNRRTQTSANNVRIEPLPNYLGVPRKQTCSCLIGCRTGVEPFRTDADRGHVFVKKRVGYIISICGNESAC